MQLDQESGLKFPTYFGNPFRSASAGQLLDGPKLNPNLMKRPDVEGTLLRSNAVAAGAAPSGTPLFGAQSNLDHVDTSRNPYFRYQGLQRLGNLVTTRSNVYAVWITVGKFEVESIAPNAVHPDGYRLTAELGIDTGDVQRHRAFYMIDRTIPVAFEPGVNHNVDDCVLLRRYIE